MIKLTNIITEILNTYQVECELLTDPKLLPKIMFKNKE